MKMTTREEELEREAIATEFPGPNDIPPPAEDQLTEEDLFRMRSLTINSKKGLGGVSETAEQSIISLADSASNFDEHVTGDQDVDEFDYDIDNSSKNSAEMPLDNQCVAVNGWLFGRKRNPDFAFNKATVTVLRWPKNIAVPECPVPVSKEQWTKAFLESTVYLIGTAHFSKESQDDVTETVKHVQPDYVMIELCPARISIISMDENTLLNESRNLNSQKIMQTIKQNGAIQGILHVLLLSMSAHVTRELSMAPGGEFRAAHRSAAQTQLCRVVLGDRPIQITLQRALASLSMWQKLKFFIHVAFSHRQTITKDEVERCKQKDLLEQLLTEMADDFPQLSHIFVEERDAYMTHVLHTLLHRNAVEKFITWQASNTGKPFQPLAVVAVVGIGHTPGIINKWNDPVDISDLILIPQPSLTSRILNIAARAAFWGSVGYLLYRGGTRIARRFA
ncbi:unnamed protein product [Caenorhabditis bovis]|uniref:TraB domain-containing protein n=1 Tax=Caenorhabditis bovis TaxID=2654633 RepID=A0A8S1F5R7_9PELO|nr:unnamed protein product [Caenorhabditis bovis]